MSHIFHKSSALFRHTKEDLTTIEALSKTTEKIALKSRLQKLRKLELQKSTKEADSVFVHNGFWSNIREVKQYFIRVEKGKLMREFIRRSDRKYLADEYAWPEIHRLGFFQRSDSSGYFHFPRCHLRHFPDEQLQAQICFISGWRITSLAFECQLELDASKTFNSNLNKPRLALLSPKNPHVLIRPVKIHSKLQLIPWTSFFRFKQSLFCEFFAR